MVRQLYLYSIEAADFPDSVTSENTLREFPLVIATIAKVSQARTFARYSRKLDNTVVVAKFVTTTVCRSKFSVLVPPR